MDLEDLVQRASQRDVAAFVELTRRFQQFAFGSALAMVGDFQRAEDVVQEAFLAAWSSLPTLTEPAAFPAWLRAIVRHCASRQLRRGYLETLPLTAAVEVPADQPAVDERVERRNQARLALAAIAGLPTALREAAALFYVHDCSHQDIAAFLGLSVTTVNNRLHAARAKLKERMVAMVSDTLHAHSLPDDFAHRIGRLVEARGAVVEALFDPQSLPDLLSELAVSDEANKRAITVQVVQRPGGGLVRAVTVGPVDGLPRGATVLNSLRHTETPINAASFERAVTALAGPAAAAPRLLETGIKAIDVLCPLVAGGTVAIAGEVGAGTTVVMEELVRRLSGGADQVSVFVVAPTWDGARAPGYSYAEELRKDGFSEGTRGAVQSFFLRADEGPWTADRLAALAPADTVIHLAREVAKAKIYPCVDPRTSRSRLLESDALDARHREIAARVRAALALLFAGGENVGAEAYERVRRLANYLAQPFFCAEPWTKRSGSHVSVATALADCADILDGRHDDLPADTFYFGGTVAELRARRPEPPQPQAA
jgi:RNA polymerase sigma factor (sigma-70 family)